MVIFHSYVSLPEGILNIPWICHEFIPWMSQHYLITISLVCCSMPLLLLFIIIINYYYYYIYIQKYYYHCDNNYYYCCYYIWALWGSLRLWPQWRSDRDSFALGWAIRQATSARPIRLPLGLLRGVMDGDGICIFFCSFNWRFPKSSGYPMVLPVIWPF